MHLKNLGLGMCSGVVIGLIFWSFCEFQFFSDRYALNQRLDNEVHRLGQKAAEEGLYLARPYMVVSYRRGIDPEAELFGELRYRTDKLYDARAHLSGKELPAEILRVISREYALGLFYKNNQDAFYISIAEACKLARQDERWMWLNRLEDKIFYLENLQSRVNSCQTRQSLEEIRQEIGPRVSEIERVLEEGAPRNPKAD